MNDLMRDCYLENPAIKIESLIGMVMNKILRPIEPFYTLIKID
jgi:hypothetical protein